jgi:hypothetical protein
MAMLTVIEPKLRSKINIRSIGRAARPESLSTVGADHMEDAIKQGQDLGMEENKLQVR